MKKLLLLIALIYFNQTDAQQNLVLNPSFEDNFLPMPCMPMQGENFPITNWTYGSLGTTDVFSALVQPNCYSYAYQNNQGPRTGNNHLLIINYIYTNPNQLNTYREYVRGKLSNSLQIGIPYRVEFYVRKQNSNGSNSGMNNIGVKFINDSAPLYPTYDVIPEIPDVNYSDAPIVDEDNWTLLSFIFVPTQPNLDAFIIGNFYSDSQTQLEFDLPNTLFFSNYLIDDVTVYAIETETGIPDEICQGDELILPNTSESGIEGTWSPAVNNQETTTYTFTPNDTNLPPIEKTVIVNPKLTPEFDSVGPFCDEIPNINALPTISNNGIEGVWSPAFNPNQTATYIFTPDDEFCSESVSMEIIIDKTPTFEPIDPFCEIDENFSLPTVSTNGISGSWSPDFDPNHSQTYTFTRDSGDCTQQVTLDIVVYPQYNFVLIHYCENGLYYVEFKSDNLQTTSITNFEWKINGTSILEHSSKINLSDYHHLLEDLNVVELSIVDENGCIHSQTIQILGKNFCKIQKGISPNGDGLNEYFDLASFGGVDLKIFNRYGSVVYEHSNYKVEWRGQSKEGKNLPTGTYFYQIQTNLDEQFTGYIQLIY